MERPRTTPSSSASGGAKSETVGESEEEEELANSEEEDEVAVAVPDLKPRPVGARQYASAMRCRSPSYIDESVGEDGPLIRFLYPNRMRKRRFSTK